MFAKYKDTVNTFPFPKGSKVKKSFIDLFFVDYDEYYGHHMKAICPLFSDVPLVASRINYDYLEAADSDYVEINGVNIYVIPATKLFAEDRYHKNYLISVTKNIREFLLNNPGVVKSLFDDCEKKAKQKVKIN